jgi:acetyl-CoA carboxylase carboxyl transferase subunit alpha
MKLTARDLLAHGIVDEVLPEPLGGAHNEPKAAVEAVVRAVEGALSRLSKLGPQEIVKGRYERYRRIGTHVTEGEMAGTRGPGE